MKTKTNQLKQFGMAWHKMKTKIVLNGRTKQTFLINSVYTHNKVHSWCGWDASLKPLRYSVDNFIDKSKRTLTHYLTLRSVQKELNGSLWTLSELTLMTLRWLQEFPVVFGRGIALFPAAPARPGRSVWSVPLRSNTGTACPCSPPPAGSERMAPLWPTASDWKPPPRTWRTPSLSPYRAALWSPAATGWWRTSRCPPCTTRLPPSATLVLCVVRYRKVWSPERSGHLNVKLDNWTTLLYRSHLCVVLVFSINITTFIWLYFFEFEGFLKP